MSTGDGVTPPKLDDFTVAAPCSAKWSEMTGDERVRLCRHCNKHVYNLSAMPRAEAEALAIEKEGTICVRLARRADGTVITDNCPVGLRAARERLCWIAAGAAAMLAAIAGIGSRSVSFKQWFVEPPKPVPPATPANVAPSENLTELKGLIVSKEHKAKLEEGYRRAVEQIEQDARARVEVEDEVIQNSAKKSR